MGEGIRIGISSCLLGEKVRYDRGHKLDHFLRDTLGQYVEYVPVCPEVECGLPVPREAMRLVGSAESPRLVTVRTQRDLTEQMQQWAELRVVELEKEGLCGFVFKSGSPSSGMAKVKVYTESGIPRKIGVGMFAGKFMEHFPLLPVEDEGRLHDAVLRERFIESIFVYARWRDTLALKPFLRGLVRFHTEHKLLLMSHSLKHLSLMGKLVARSRQLSAGTLVNDYQRLLAQALRLTATKRKNTNVLQHVMGYFKKDLAADEKQELLEVIQRYYDGNLPLIVPVTLLNHYVRKFNQPYLQGQWYLHPHPIELQLRNHV